MPELAEPRQQAILDLLNSGGHAVVSSMARQLGVSEMTIRRDLQFLESRGLAVRVHGGALAGERSRFSNRLSANSRAKSKAVAKFTPELPEQGCVYFDGSTTVLNLVKHLKGLTRLQVATNNIETFNRVAALRGPTPILIGGSLDIRTDNLIGPLALRSIEALAFEKAFCSAWGLDAGVGLNEVTMEDAQVKDQVARRARQVYVALDHSKLGVVTAGAWVHGRDKSILATDLEPGDGRLAPFRSMFNAII
ncbi:MAG: DeoR/GlpR family DNA-binding transcription regulator [Planctomycetota bacterium]|nr:DeoR/GlpR family DNA-binding transcription regulator [Planctomycetota bacterium]